MWYVLSMRACGMYAGCGQGCVGLLCCVHSDRFVMTRSMTVPSRKRATLPMRISWRVGIRGSKAGLPPWPPRLL